MSKKNPAENNKNPLPATAKPAHKILRLMLRLLLMLLAIIMTYYAIITTQITWWYFYNPQQSSFMHQRLSVMRQTNPDATLQWQWRDYNKISNQLKRAVVAAEDDQFLYHDGFDIDGIEAAMKKNLKKGRIVSGGSTISQQLAKNLFLSNSRSYLRKANEAVITLLIETLWSKRRILEVYLNIAEWGDGVFGAEAAAQHYYHIPASALNTTQAARLAVLLPSPIRYEKRFGPYLQRHANSIARRMRYANIPR